MRLPKCHDQAHLIKRECRGRPTLTCDLCGRSIPGTEARASCQICPCGYDVCADCAELPTGPAVEDALHLWRDHTRTTRGRRQQAKAIIRRLAQRWLRLSERKCFDQFVAHADNCTRLRDIAKRVARRMSPEGRMARSFLIWSLGQSDNGYARASSAGGHRRGPKMGFTTARGGAYTTSRAITVATARGLDFEPALKELIHGSSAKAIAGNKSRNKGN